jgi:hypothetical protein
MIATRDLPAEVQLCALTAQIAHELCVLAAEMEELQSTLSDVFRATPPDEALVIRAQALDRAFQCLSQLSHALEGVASLSDPSWRVALGPILQPISLQALALRLSGQGADEAESCDLEWL